MDWKSEAIGKLRGYLPRRISLENIPAEIHRLEIEYRTIRSSEGKDMPGGQGDNSHREDALLSNIVRRQELAMNLENARAWCAIVERGLSALNERDAMVLDRFYIHPQKNTAARLCEEMGLEEESSVFRIRRKALRRFTTALYFKEG